MRPLHERFLVDNVDSGGADARQASGAGETGRGGRSGVAGGMSLPGTGSGDAHRRPGTSGFDPQLGLLGLAGAGAAAAAVLASRASASREASGLGLNNSDT